ncbi:MAG: hypothetical protein MUE44_23130 [Oscillatoriaceae cyanobacterium Prado104]|nr:hypothetical protein [Oscillatoriaceae cyanobacterium Prado104]
MQKVIRNGLHSPGSFATIDRVAERVAFGTANQKSIERRDCDRFELSFLS